MVQEIVGEHEKLLKFPNNYHRALGLPKIVPAPIASSHSDEQTHREFELKRIGRFPGIHTASPAGVNKGRHGEIA